MSLCPRMPVILQCDKCSSCYALHTIDFPLKDSAMLQDIAGLSETVTIFDCVSRAMTGYVKSRRHFHDDKGITSIV